MKNQFKKSLMEKIKIAITKVFSKKALADEGQANTNSEGVPTTGEPQTNNSTQSVPTQEPPSINYEDLISEARRQEKEKLYPKIKELEGALKTKTNGFLISLGEKDNEIKLLKEKLTQYESAGTIDNSEIEKMKKDLESLREENQKYKNKEVESELNSYKEELIKNYEGKVVPELISGKTKEELEESIKNSNAVYERMLGSLGGGTVQVPPVVNPDAGQVPIQNNVKDVSSMTMEEYAEYRKTLNL